MPLKKIVFVIPNLKLGGAERALTTLANCLASDGLIVSIITFDHGHSFYALDKSISIVPLNTTTKGFFGSLNVIKGTPKYIKSIRKIKPDIVISFMDYPNVICILWNFIAKQKLIIAQRTDPVFGILPYGFRSLRKLLYKKAHAISLQTERSLKIFEHIKIKLPKIKSIIPNPLNKDCYDDNVLTTKENVILTAGRLSPEKQFNLLIDIFSKTDHKDWQLWIAGSGPEMAALQNQVNNLKLSENIKLLGAQKNIKQFYQRSKIFALTSRTEGYPNALCEAMANGCACISFDCDTGPSEIIINNINGLLIENGNVIEFQKQLQSLITDDNKIASLSFEALKIRKSLNIKNITEQWYALMNIVINN